MDNKRDFPALLDQLVNTLSKIVTTNLKKRAATMFAIIGLTGELGVEYGILPWAPDSTLQATLTVFQRYQAYQGPGQTEDSQILQAISDFIAKHGDSRFSAHL